MEAALGLGRPIACLLKCSPVRRCHTAAHKRAESMAGSMLWWLHIAVQEQGRKGGRVWALDDSLGACAFAQNRDVPLLLCWQGPEHCTVL